MLFGLVEVAIVFAIAFAGMRLCREASGFGVVTIGLLVGALFAVSKLEALHETRKINDAS